MSELSIEERFSEMSKWLVENGGFVNPGLKVGVEDGIRFLYTDIELPQSEFLFMIQKKCCINPETENIFTDSFDQNVWFLLKQFSLGKESFYKPYIDFIQTFEELEYHPLIQYNQNVHSGWVKISNLFTSQIVSHLTKLKTLFDKIKESNTIPEEYLTLKNMLWSYINVLTKTTTGEKSIIPMNDLLTKQTKTNILKKKMPFLFVTSIEKLEPNCRLYDSFEIMNDIVFFVTHGYVQADQTQHYVTLDIKSSGTIHNTITDELDTIIKNITSPFALMYSGVSDDLIRLFRTSNLTETKLSELKSKDDKYNKSMISLDNELSTYKNIINLAKNQLKNFTEEEIKFSTFILSQNNIMMNNKIEYKIAISVICHYNVCVNTIATVKELWNSFLV